MSITCFGIKSVTWIHQRGTSTRKLRTGRFHTARLETGPPCTFPEIQRSAERPPSRLSAECTRQPAGWPWARARPRFASEQGGVRPSHQRVPPSQAIKVRALVFPASNPETGRPSSTNIGPAWSNSRISVAADLPSPARRAIRLRPSASSHQTPPPSDDAGFQDPAGLPSDTTNPSGLPSGVKNPPFAAASPAKEFAALSASANLEPGPAS